MIADGAENHETVSIRGSSFDNLKLMLAGLIFGATCLTVVGIIPVAIMGTGLVLSLKSGDDGNVKATSRFVQAIVLVAMVGMLIGAAVYHGRANNIASIMQDPDSASAYEQTLRRNPLEAAPIGDPYYSAKSQFYRDQSTYIDYVGVRYNLLFGAALSFAYAILLQVLWVAPVTRQMPIWRSRKKPEAKSDNGSRIIKRDSLASYSVADELIKWSKLHAEGLVSDDEFEEARTKLLANS